MTVHRPLSGTQHGRRGRRLLMGSRFGSFWGLVVIWWVLGEPPWLLAWCAALYRSAGGCGVIRGQ
jgi:hypothetical protein